MSTLGCLCSLKVAAALVHASQVATHRSQLALRAGQVFHPEPEKKKNGPFSVVTSYLQRHKPAVRASAAAAKLRRNLLQEQEVIGELDTVVHLQLLNPLQAAFCMVTTYPHHCDVLSLLNAVQPRGGE
jgi:hypothetical protein